MSIAWKKLHHLSLETSNVSALIDFYTKVLGFEAIKRPNFSFEGAWLLRNDLQIHLIAGQPGPKGEEINSRHDHVALFVDDVAPAEAVLKEFQITYQKKVQTGTGVVQLFFHDPEGNQIELGHYPPAQRFKS